MTQQEQDKTDRIVKKYYDEFNTKRSKGYILNDAVRKYALDNGIESKELEDAFNLMSVKEFKKLTTINTTEACKAGANFADLKDMFLHNRTKFEALTHPRAVEAYKAGTSFDDLSNVFDRNPTTLDQIIRFIEAGALQAGVTSDDLKSLYDNINDISALTSPEAVAAYQAGATVNELENIFNSNYRIY